MPHLSIGAGRREPASLPDQGTHEYDTRYSSDGVNVGPQSSAWITVEPGMSFPSVAPHLSFEVAPFLAASSPTRAG